MDIHIYRNSPGLLRAGCGGLAARTGIKAYQMRATPTCAAGKSGSFIAACLEVVALSCSLVRSHADADALVAADSGIGVIPGQSCILLLHLISGLPFMHLQMFCRISAALLGTQAALRERLKQSGTTKMHLCLHMAPVLRVAASKASASACSHMAASECYLGLCPPFHQTLGKGSSHWQLHVPADVLKNVIGRSQRTAQFFVKCEACAAQNSTKRRFLRAADLGTHAMLRECLK